MYLYYAAVGLAILSNLFYHVSQKLTPAAANPALAITVTYLVAMGVSLVILWWFFPITAGLGPALRQLNWARRALPWLADGEAASLPPGFFDERVFAVWRSAGEHRVLCLVNLSGQPLTATAALPEMPRYSRWVRKISRQNHSRL